jgi:hypothetical protein
MDVFDPMLYVRVRTGIYLHSVLLSVCIREQSSRCLMSYSADVTIVPAPVVENRRQPLHVQVPAAAPVQAHALTMLSNRLHY